MQFFPRPKPQLFAIESLTGFSLLAELMTARGINKKKGVWGRVFLGPLFSHATDSNAREVSRAFFMFNNDHCIEVVDDRVRIAIDVI